jgi:hypothetical protein
VAYYDEDNIKPTDDIILADRFNFDVRQGTPIGVEVQGVREVGNANLKGITPCGGTSTTGSTMRVGGCDRLVGIKTASGMEHML